MGSARGPRTKCFGVDDDYAKSAERLQKMKIENWPLLLAIWRLPMIFTEQFQGNSEDKIPTEMN